MNEVVVVHRDTIPNGVKVASHVQTMNRYKIEKKSFSIIAPAKERTFIKISHGSHRFEYEYRKDGPAQLIHSGLVSNVFIPENCILIIDENLLVHAGSESMTSGYAPVFSPRYFSYLHHKDKEFEEDIMYRDFYVCPKDCAFCNDQRLIDIANQIKDICEMTNCNDLLLARKNGSKDWIAGDLVLLGWVIYKRGVVVDTELEMRLAHEFQTLLLTNTMTKYYTKKTWVVIDSAREEGEMEKYKGKIIPDTCRHYMKKKDKSLRPGFSLLWGKRKMIPYIPDDQTKHLEWFNNNHFVFIPQFFVMLEKSLTTYIDSDDSTTDVDNNGNWLSLILGIDGVKFDDYMCSGQSILANFGFVREQDLHMDFVPIRYEN